MLSSFLPAGPPLELLVRERSPKRIPTCSVGRWWTSRCSAPASHPRTSTGLNLAESMYGGGVLARYIALEAGLTNVAGTALNRHCAAGLAAVETAAASIMAGMDEAIIAGGVQSMSNTPMEKKRTVGTQDWVDWMSPSHPDSPEAPSRDMSITVGWNTAEYRRYQRREWMRGAALDERHRRHRRGPLRQGDSAHQGHDQRRFQRSSKSTSTVSGQHPGEARQPGGSPPVDPGPLDHGRATPRRQ